MTSKTERNFIYDYLIHLDSFLLHGVAEVGAPQKAAQKKEPLINATENANSPFKNQNSPVVFVIQNQTNLFSNAEEKNLFSKMITAMNIVPESVFILDVNELSKDKENNIDLEKTIEALQLKQASHFICFGFTIENNIQKINSQEYHLANTWKSTSLLEKEIVIAAIPTLKEMIDDARHKKAAWAHLKRVCNAIEDGKI